LTIFLANFDFRARKTTGAVKRGKFPLGVLMAAMRYHAMR
jgi:hypothetical protein